MTQGVLSNTTDNDSLNLSTFYLQKRQKQKLDHQHYILLKPTKCPTRTCQECKVRYIDRLGLDIFVICFCKCHKGIVKYEV
jgi:hypothetical protein